MFASARRHLDSVDAASLLRDQWNAASLQRVTRSRPRYTGPMSSRIIISHYQADALVRSRRLGETQVRTSVDLNLTMTLGELTDAGLALPDGRVAPWAAI